MADSRTGAGITTTRRSGTPIYGMLVLVIGALLAAGGARLSMLGGSPYYLLAGAGLAGSGVLLIRGRTAGAALYGAIFVATVAWAIWEVGFDLWALMPRLAAMAVVGLWLLTPGARHRLVPAGATGPAPIRWLAIGFGLVIAVAVGAVLHNIGPAAPADPAYQRGMIAARPAEPSADPSLPGADWHEFGGDASGRRFSTLDQINPANVDKLQVAWTYRAGNTADGVVPNIEATPLKVGDTLYLCTSTDDAIALDAETGKERWHFRSGIKQKVSIYGHCRGVTYFQTSDPAADCPRRILMATIDARLIALDAATGQLCQSFGTAGETSLLTGMGQTGDGYYYVSSAPTLIRGKVVLGGWVADGQYWGEPSGVIRAYDATTGKFAWAFDVGRPDRQTEPPPGETYTRSTPNSWAPMSADETLGLVYAPTGIASGADYYGAQRRPFDDQYDTSVVAIDADTGKPRWSFQTTHHDLWDYDVPSQPTLVDIPMPDGVRHALVQATKRGELFLLDRVTGQPIAQVEERTVSQRGAAPGERVSPTQPFSVGMPSVAGPDLTERAMWGITPFDQLWCRILFRSSRYDGPLTPPGLDWNLFSPGYGGGSNWGSVTIDPDRQLLFANAIHMATRSKLLPRDEADRRGLKPMSSAVESNISAGVAQAGTPYGVDVSPFLSPLRVPCQNPPYGTLTAIDLVTQKLVWTHPFGSAEDTGPLGIASHLPLPMGMPNMGGSLATRSGLLFIGATQDANFRAFDSATGRLLWEQPLPAGGNATPMTYVSQVTGRQFVVIAATGHLGLQNKTGDYVIAYTLPQGQ